MYSECSEDAMNVFNKEGLVHVLLRHLDPAIWGHTMALAVAECLLCVSENNPSAASVLLPVAEDLVGFISHPKEQPINLHFATTVIGRGCVLSNEISVYFDVITVNP